MAGNGSTADEQELEEALRLSMIVDDNTTSGTGSQSNSTTEVGGTQSRSTASPEEFAQMIAFCLATAIQQPLSPTVSQEPMRADQSGMGFPLVMGRKADHAGSGEQANKTDTTTMINTVVPSTPGRALFPPGSSPTSTAEVSSPTSTAEVTRLEDRNVMIIDHFNEKCISTITFQEQITAVTINASSLAEMGSNLTTHINGLGNTESKAEMVQILVSDMGASGNAGKTKFNISGKAIADDGVGTELAFMLARAMINEDTGDLKNQMMDALNQMSKSDEGINTVKKVTTNMARKIWMSVMRTMASALSKADDDKMKRMGNSLSKDVVQMDSSNNVTNLLTKTAEAIANVKKPYKTGAYGEMRTKYEGKLPKRVMDVDFEKVLTHFDQFSRLEEAKKESELAKENPLPLPPSPISVLTSLASAKSSDSLICALQVQINKFVKDTHGHSFVELEGIAQKYSANKKEMMARHHDDQRSIANVSSTAKVLSVASPGDSATEGNASALVTPKLEDTLKEFEGRLLAKLSAGKGDRGKGEKPQLPTPRLPTPQFSTILPTLSADEQKIKAEAKAEGKCVSYNLGRMGSQAHEAGTARCNDDREKLRAGGIRLADTCPKCSKGTSQLVKSLEAADK